MGLDPILLLEEPPLTENYTINIIRPGEELEVEEKNQILAENQANKVSIPNEKDKNNDKNSCNRT